MRKTLAVLSFTLVHAGLSIAALPLAFSAGMARFDTGHVPTLIEKVLDASVLVLYFPLVHLSDLVPREWFPGLWGYLPVFLNSAFWAVLLIYAYLWLRGKSA